MLKNLILLILLLVISCVIPPGTRFNGKVIRTGDHDIFGNQHYKYKCKKVGDCCEVGKNCKEDIENE